MKEETHRWLQYSGENLESAGLLLEGNLYNPCLQNVQQAVEKMLKAMLIEFALPLKRTHSINELTRMLANIGKNVAVTEEECDLLDSVYLPSKYPLGGVLPDFDPDEAICSQCLSIAERVKKSIDSYL